MLGNDLLLESFLKIKLIELRIEVKNNYQENEDQFLINCLVVGNTDLDIDLLSEKQLSLLNNLQRINTKLIKQGLLFADRKKRLIDFAETTKLI